MAVTADRVIVELEAKFDRYNANLDRADRKFSDAMGSIQRSAGLAESFVKGALAGIGGAVASVGIGALAAGFLSLAEASKKMDAQLRLATSGFGSFAKAQADVARLAADTRSGLEETTNLYGNFVRASREAGRSQDEASRATETFSKALKIGGADASAAASATLQFGQALASGALRGDEFNSIMEASPRVARLLADALGVPIGQLRKMAEEGKITSDILFAALTDRKFTAGIDQEFQQLPVTFDQAMEQVRNAAITVFGAFDKGGEFSNALSNFVLQGSGGFADLATAAEEFGRRVRAEFAGLSTIWQPILSAGFDAFDQLRSYGMKAGIDIGAALKLALNPLGALADRFPGRQAAAAASYSSSASRAGAATQRARRMAELAQGITGQDMFGRTLPGQTANAASGRPVIGLTGKSRASGRPRTPKAAAEATLEELVNKSIEAIRRLTPDDLTSARTAADRAANSLYDSLGIDPFSGIREGVDSGSNRIAGSNRRTDQEVEANEQIASDYRERMEDQVRTLADLYEDAFIGGTGNIFDNFKRIGLRVVAEVLAKFTAAQINGGGFNLGGALSSAVGSFLPGFANGGSPPVNRPSIVGERGPEIFIPRTAGTIVPNHALGRSMGQTVVQNISVDARNSVNPEGFERRILAISGQQAQQAAAVMGQGVLKAMPARINQFQTDGI